MKSIVEEALARSEQESHLRSSAAAPDQYDINAELLVVVRQLVVIKQLVVVARLVLAKQLVAAE